VKSDVKGALALAMLITGTAAWLVMGGKKPLLDPPLGTMSAAPPVLSAPPLDSAPSAPAPRASSDPSPTAEAPPAKKPRASSSDDRVRSIVGRWRSENGITVDVDPPRDHEDDHVPPYRLVFRGPGLPRSGYGCEFAALEKNVDGPAATTVFYSAWCSKNKRSLVAVSFDIGLSIVILGDGKIAHRADGLTRAGDSDRPRAVGAP